jgi:hypothetical protein
MNSLAVLYDEQGQYDQAQPLYEECLETRQSTLGKTHPDTLCLMNNWQRFKISKATIRRLASCVEKGRDS